MLQKEKQNTYSKFNSACLLTSSFFLLTSKNQSCINFSCSSSQPANKKQVQDLTKRFFPKSCILYHQGFKTRYSIEKLCFLKKTTQLREERYHQSGVFKIFSLRFRACLPSQNSTKMGDPLHSHHHLELPNKLF